MKTISLSYLLSKISLEYNIDPKELKDTLNEFPFTFYYGDDAQRQWLLEDNPIYAQMLMAATVLDPECEEVIITND